MIQLRRRSPAFRATFFEFVGRPPDTSPDLVLCCCMRNEADILPSLLRFHYDEGVDFILAVDHESSDGTREILEDEARSGRLAYAPMSGSEYPQGNWMSELGRVAHQLGAAWVINADADEFWMPRAGTLRELFLALPESVNVVYAFHRNFLPPVEGEGFSPERQVYWDARAEGAFYSNPKNLPKVAHRPGHHVLVANGNHWVTNPEGILPLAAQVIDVLHFPIRSLSQLEQRVAARAGAPESRDKTRIAKVAGPHMRGLIAAGRGGLRSMYAEVADPEQVRKRLAQGEYAVDTRLCERLASAERRPEGHVVRTELRLDAQLLDAWQDAASEPRPTVSPPLAAASTSRKQFAAEVVGRGTFTGDWFSKGLRRWEPWIAPLADSEPRILQIGVFDGLSACYFLWRFPDASLTCVDPFAGEAAGLEPTFDANVELFGAGRVRKIKGDSRRALPDLLAEGAEFEFVYVDGSHQALDVIVDAALSWQLLAPGGMLVFDDYRRWAGKEKIDPLHIPKRGVDAFLRLVEGRCDVLFVDYRLGLRKHRE